jgi:hypothetical protein
MTETHPEKRYRETAMKRLIILSALAAIIGISTAAATTAEPSAPQLPSEIQDNWLKRVEAKQVCMTTNKFTGHDQIPIIIHGKTYYDCCRECMAKLQTDPATRVAIDPANGKTVDKATAIIGPRPMVQPFTLKARQTSRLPPVPLLEK